MDETQRRFPGGRYKITGAQSAALCAALGSDPAATARVHPIYYYIATQVGMGLTVEQLCARCDFDVADGPVMTRSHVRFERELVFDEEYEVTGEILSLVRRPSRTFGAVDVLTYGLRLIDASGGVAAVCTNEWVLPRRNVGAA